MGIIVKIQRFLSLVLVAALALGMILTMRPLSPVQAEKIKFGISQPAPVDLPWPAYGQAAIGAVGYGLLDARGDQKPVPIASLTKLVTALTVLNKHPLKAGEPGPALVLTEEDAALYPAYFARQGSVVPVRAGQQMSQYQALQAMLIPSANNMADSLAIWAFGSLDNYVRTANSYLKVLGVANTTIADASGFSPASVSTAGDLVQLGIIALQNPVIAEIVAQQEAQIPEIGTVTSTNWLLGRDNIVGIKTGNTDQAGGCYLSAAKHIVDGKEIVTVSAVLGAADLYQAMADSRQILSNSKNIFSHTKAVKKGEVVASYHAAWGESAKVVAKDDLELYAWHKDHVAVTSEFKTLSGPLKAGTTVGVIELRAGLQTVRSEAVLKDDLRPPSPAWRLLR